MSAHTRPHTRPLSQVHTIALAALCALAGLHVAGCGDDSAPATSTTSTNNGGTATNNATTASDAGGGDDAGDDTGTPDADDDATPDAAPDVAPSECELPDVANTPGLVATDRGYAIGVQDYGVWSWRGIPYAAPPVGDLRWRAPEPAECWGGAPRFDTFGPKCPQLSITGPNSTEAIGDEDCLTVNVWSPVEGNDGDARPVMVFIHGGANIVGSSSEPLLGQEGRYIYDGRHLAARGDAVVVTFNYRLGMLGFLSTPELDVESGRGASGNYGLMDQVAALRWVQTNISAFGGDPGRVMVFGESAGALNTCMMVATPLAEGLFHSALMQSGGCPDTPKAAIQATSSEAAELAGCGDVEGQAACLRAVNALDLVEAAPGNVGVGPSANTSDLSWGPNTDGYVLPQGPLDMIASGAHNDVPLVVGSNADEMASPALNRVTIEDEAQYISTVELVGAAFGDDAPDRILEVYPASDYPTPNDAWVQVLTDAWFTCSARSIARTVADAQQAPVYRYFYTHRPQTRDGEGRATHGIELLYVFRTLEDIPFYYPPATDARVADTLMDAWLSFAATGSPKTDATDWPEYDRATDPVQILSDPPEATQDVRGVKCDLWDDLLGLR